MQALDASKIKELYWNKNNTAKEIAEAWDISIWSLYNFMAKNNIARRSYSEASYVANKNKPQFQIKEHLSITDEKLKIAGIMLYWAEGAQTGGTVDFSNCNPRMVEVFLNFLRKICGVKEERLRVYLYTHSYASIEKSKEYWHNITGIPLAQFTKPYVRKGNPNLSSRKMLYGMVHIRYNDTKLLEMIKKWIKEYLKDDFSGINGIDFSGEVPKRSNGSDCVNAASRRKFEMEKRVNSGEPLAQQC